MSFNDVLVEDIVSAGFNSKPYRRDFKPRTHISLSAVEADEDSSDIKIGEIVLRNYDGPMAQRYVTAKAITYDLIATLYDVNSSSLAVFRMYECKDEMIISLKKWVAALKNPNLEGRVIGLQDGAALHCVMRTVDLLMDSKAEIVEIDLFGKEMRSVVVDSKLGTTQDILIEDRIYRAGERATAITLEDFERSVRT